MGGPARALAHPLGSQAQPIRMGFSPQKGFITDRNTPQFHQWSGWLVSDDPADEEAGCGCPGLAWLHIVCGCEAGWTIARSLKTRDICCNVLCDKTADFRVSFYCPQHKVQLSNDHAV